LNKLLAETGLLPAQGADSSSVYVTAIVLGLTAGLTEELARAVGYAIVRRARRYDDAVMMGLGHGGIEAMIIGVLVAASVSSLWLMQAGVLPEIELTAEQSAALSQQLELITGSPMLAFLPLLERLIALTLQVSLSIIVLLAFVRRNWLYVVMAVVVHAAVDFVAVLATEQLQDPWLVEALIAVLVLPVAYYAWRQRSRTQRARIRPAPPVGRQLAIFGAALGHEVLFQWRSKRLLIIAGVFLVFGMISPLLAEFTPQLLGNIEGAEQFADLVPDPTLNDAIGQYVRNITQFGFLLAIILGMGAVAAEKEKGTAAIVLSKPLPRWAFLNSKFASQALTYALGFTLAAVAAYFYTLVLFEAIDPFDFLLANVLLLAWLLVFVAVTLLGSALGKSTPAAAGWATLGSVILLVAGSLPRVGALAPSGLVAWSSQLALGDLTGLNGGALAMSLVLILVLLISSMAVFEEQEV
jgi:ABC-2 type transport system permease protein